MSKTKNNKGRRNLYKHITLPVLNLLKHEFLILEALGHTAFKRWHSRRRQFGFFRDPGLLPSKTLTSPGSLWEKNWWKTPKEVCHGFLEFWNSCYNFGVACLRETLNVELVWESLSCDCGSFVGNSNLKC